MRGPAPLLRRAAPLLAIAACIGIAIAVRAADIPADERRSGYQDMGRETQAMQDDDTANPAMLWVLDGETTWQARVGSSGRACADCHGDAAQSMKGVAARYPAFDAVRKAPVDLATRINLCRTDQQHAEALAPESRELLALTALIARQSRGQPIVSEDPRLQPFIEQGRALFTTRAGQLDLACSQCHDDNRGRKLAGNTIPQAHPTAYPIYRLEWQGLGSLQRRLRNCQFGTRAESSPYGSPELIALETYLMWRARGMKMESPGVRP